MIPSSLNRIGMFLFLIAISLLVPSDHSWRNCLSTSAIADEASGEESDELKRLIDTFASNDWEQVSLTEVSLQIHHEKTLPLLVQLLDRDEFVKLQNTADLIYPGAESFWGHGCILRYDIDWLSVRAGWMLEQIAFEDFGFSETGIDHDTFLNAATAGVSDVPLRDIAPIKIDAATRKKNRSLAIQRAKQWWEANKHDTNRMTWLIAALNSGVSNRSLKGLYWLRSDDVPIEGLSKERYISEILPTVKRLTQSRDEAISQQAAILAKDYDTNEWRCFDSRNDLALFLAAHPRRTDQLIRPWEIHNLINSQRARELCRRLDGHDAFRKSFEIENATVGWVNGMPDSLHVSLRTTNRGLINGVWWWNPLDDHGAPKFNWNDLIRIHDVASDVLAKHQWLSEWRESSFGRIVELHALGENIAETESELENYLLPVWRHAGLAGKPRFGVLARRGDSVWAQLYFGMDEPRILVTAVTEPDWKSEHWLDRLDIYFHPNPKENAKALRYVVVEPGGNWEIRTYRRPTP